MREFAPHGSLAALSRPAKVLYSAFALLNLAGLASSVALYDGFVDFRASATPSELYGRLVAHYGPTGLDRRALMEVTHAHLFTMSVLLLVAGHLFLLTRAPLRLKTTLITLGVAAVGLHLAAPWIVREAQGRAGSALLYPISGAILILTLGVMTILPSWEMWRGATSIKARSSPPSSEPPAPPDRT
jgi:hypothetical protein